MPLGIAGRVEAWDRGRLATPALQGMMWGATLIGVNLRFDVGGTEFWLLAAACSFSPLWGEREVRVAASNNS
jgi:hypothetical protein